MKVIIYPQKDDKIAIVTPMYPLLAPLKKIAERSVPENTEYIISDNVNIDKYFFDAYEYNKGDIRVNLEKAKEIQKNKWRQVREKEFKKLDLEFMLALEKGDVELQKQIAIKKQELRDVTKTILPDDLESIKMFWPNSLTPE